ncbi:uncharacterized protein EMH_0002230 [Eimeria mitis]|uniref:Uncharacterized protein n=1 Tax=Eimeria mitis TaxID=44415 RepID=U6JTM2_9EIME|nr:uncharacterized protein EMH_0002230 [Eimeria mitis]CDJ28815.1 hypothetical protein EMH_0002230 [Eimeria mitis]
MLLHASPFGARPSVNQQLLTERKLSFPLTNKRKLEGILMTSIPYAGQETWSRLAQPTQRNRHSRPRLHKLLRGIFLATAASVVIILASLSICRTLSGRYKFSGVTHRELAEGGEGIDEEQHAIIEGCLELEEEMGLMEHRAASASEGDWSSRVAELVSMLSGAAAAQQTMQEHVQTEQQLQLGKQFLEGRSDLETEDVELGSVETPAFHASVQPGGPGGLMPGLEPDSWLEAVPSITRSPEAQGVAGPSPVTDGASNAGQASASPAPRQGDGGGLKYLLNVGGIQKHPYVRLPVLQEGVVPRPIRVSVLFDKSFRRPSYHSYLLALRRLFAKDTLDQEDVNVIVPAVEKLVNTSWFQSRSGPRGPSPVNIAETYGCYFMVFDAVVCASQLLGEHMQRHLWWDKFIASFNTNFPLPVSGRRECELTKFHVDLAKRLAAALDIYKQGIRPALSEVYALKKLLFCYPLGHHRLKSSIWEPWQKDGNC